MPELETSLDATDIAALRGEAAYSPYARVSAEERGGIEFLETHISWLFFVKDRVYKIKKPLNLGFLDYSTLEQRRRLCHEEVRLNRRLAPDVYIGVVPLRRTASGQIAVHSSSSEPPIEWAVEMVRLPAERMFGALLDRGEIDNQEMNDLAQFVADFHAQAATGAGVDEHGAPAAIRANVEENLAQLEPFVGPLDDDSNPTPRVITAAQHAWLTRRRAEFLDSHEELLERRVVEHKIRDGHGDLHADNLCLFPDRPGHPGRIVAYDAIEFSPALRAGDVAAELAFLTMDIDRRGFPAFSRYLARRYAELTGDGDLRVLEPFYKSYRAVVRGKVTAFAAAGAKCPAEREERRLEAARALQLATAYELPPALVLLAGLPATGKTWLAERIARPLRAVALHSDVRRKTLAGIAPTASASESWNAGLYTEESKLATYRSLLAQSVELLEAGHATVVDATFSSRRFRAPFVDAAVRLGLPYYVVHVTAPDELVRARLAARAADPHNTSDADLAVYERARTTFESPDEVPAGHVLDVVSGIQPAEVASAKLLDHMIALS